MSHSDRALDQVLVEFPEGYASWMTPAQARRIIAVDPRIEIIDETSDRYQAVLKHAGPKPTIIIPATERYHDDES